MSGTTELFGDPEILTTDCAAPMGIAFPAAMIVPAPDVASISTIPPANDSVNCATVASCRGNVFRPQAGRTVAYPNPPKPFRDWP